MHLVGNIQNRPAPTTSSASPTNASTTTGGNFPIASLARAGAPSSRGISAGMPSSFGAQTMSTLLQTQDLSEQEQLHGHGGGGGHRGGMKTTPGAEAEEAAESEEAQRLRRRKKLLKAMNKNGIMETAEAEGADPAGPAQKPGANKPARDDASL
jgi:hypothetical protein